MVVQAAPGIAIASPRDEREDKVRAQKSIVERGPVGVGHEVTSLLILRGPLIGHLGLAVDFDDEVQRRLNVEKHLEFSHVAAAKRPLDNKQIKFCYTIYFVGLGADTLPMASYVEVSILVEMRDLILGCELDQSWRTSIIRIYPPTLRPTDGNGHTQKHICVPFRAPASANPHLGVQ